MIFIKFIYSHHHALQYCSFNFIIAYLCGDNNDNDCGDDDIFPGDNNLFYQIMISSTKNYL